MSAEHECGEPHPVAQYAKCVKPSGHTDEHAAPLGYHPESEHGPEQYEWGTWPGDARLAGGAS